MGQPFGCYHYYQRERRFCKSVGNKNEEVAGKRFSLSKTLIALDTLLWLLINKDGWYPRSKQDLIHPIHCCPSPLANNNSKRMSQLTESKAFSKSSLRKSASTLKLCEVARISWAQATLSKMYLFQVKTDWTWSTRRWMWERSRLVRTLELILSTILRRLIGSLTIEALSFFEMRATKT